MTVTEGADASTLFELRFFPGLRVPLSAADQRRRATQPSSGVSAVSTVRLRAR